MHPFLLHLERTMHRLDRHAPIRWHSVYEEACLDHAWLLRAEGLKFKEIAYRLGLSLGGYGARMLVLKRGRSASRQMRKARFTISYANVQSQR